MATRSGMTFRSRLSKAQHEELRMKIASHLMDIEDWLTDMELKSQHDDPSVDKPDNKVTSHKGTQSPR